MQDPSLWKIKDDAEEEDDQPEEETKEEIQLNGTTEDTVITQALIVEEDQSKIEGR